MKEKYYFFNKKKYIFLFFLPKGILKLIENLNVNYTHNSQKNLIKIIHSYKYFI